MAAFTRSAVRANAAHEQGVAADDDAARTASAAAAQRMLLDPDAGAEDLWYRGKDCCSEKRCVAAAIEGTSGSSLSERVRLDHATALKIRADKQANSYVNRHDPSNFDRKLTERKRQKVSKVRGPTAAGARCCCVFPGPAAPRAACFSARPPALLLMHAVALHAVAWCHLSQK